MQMMNQSLMDIFKGKWLLLTLLFLAGGFFLQAQEFRGSITGTVTDTAGAILPGTTVIAVGPQQKKGVSE